MLKTITLFAVSTIAPIIPKREPKVKSNLSRVIFSYSSVAPRIEVGELRRGLESAQADLCDLPSFIRLVLRRNTVNPWPTQPD